MSALTVLGSCAAWPEPGRACSGFLLSHNGFRILLDLGFGTASRLLEHGMPDAVVCTHAHPDHCADLSALGRALYYSRRRIPLYCNRDVVDVLTAMEPAPDPHTVFEIRDPSSARRVGPFQLETFELPHHQSNIGIRLSADDLIIAYTGDTGPCAELTALGSEADCFIVEATLQGPPPETAPRYLMTAAEAGRAAESAGAKSLLLTHFWPGSDRAISAREAASAFTGEILIAEENAVIDIRSRGQPSQSSQG